MPLLPAHLHQPKAYQQYKGIVARCDNRNRSRYPTYDKCKNLFKSKYEYAEWAMEQIGFTYVDSEIDKDILVPGNRMYSRDTCVMVPEVINLLFRQLPASELLTGVRKTRCGTYESGTMENYTFIRLGIYDTEYEAHMAYKLERERYTRQVADELRHRIDKRVYEAMVSYEFQTPKGL
jgi:hypothetical protein